MGKCTQTPFLPNPFLPIRRAVCFFIRPYERLGKLFHQYSDKGSPRFLRDIAKGRKKKIPTKTPPPATNLLDVLFNNFCTEQQILSTNLPSLQFIQSFSELENTEYMDVEAASTAEFQSSIPNQNKNASDGAFLCFNLQIFRTTISKSSPHGC